jgi:hypothetical protein
LSVFSAVVPPLVGGKRAQGAKLRACNRRKNWLPRLGERA